MTNLLSKCIGDWGIDVYRQDRNLHPFLNLASKQPQLAGLSLYVPLHSSCLMWGADPYSVRSVARMGTCLGMDTRSSTFTVEQMRRASEELKSLRPLYLGDYYPLFEQGDLSDKHWYGWQFDRPDLGKGFAMLFRRAASPYMASKVSFRGLDPHAKYEVTFAETYHVKETRLLTGRELRQLRAEIGTAPGSLLIRYSKYNS